MAKSANRTRTVPQPDQTVTPVVEPRERTSVIGVFLRITWLGIGNLIMALCVINIALNKAPFFAKIDILYGACVVALPIIRYLDIVLFHGETAEGEPATMAHWKKYVLLFLGVSLSAWLAAHGIACLLA